MKYTILSVLFTAIFFLSGCSSKTADDYMKMAHENVMNKNISEAINNYQIVINQFPKTQQAPEALFQIATIYQNKMIENLSDVESFKKAEETFRQVFNLYPDYKEAPKALFLSGFILANDLKNYESATSTYNLFLQKYPDHELASAAREELENMGLSPDQILQKKTQKNI